MNTNPNRGERMGGTTMKARLVSRWKIGGALAGAAALAALVAAPAPALAQEGEELVIATHTENQAMQAQ
jgi:hypothetical protein